MPILISSGDAKHRIIAEVADEADERQQGLMCRETVPFGVGMLFIFQHVGTLNFWMFNTYAPLDIVYLDQSGFAVNALRMEPCPRPTGYDDGEWQSHCSTAASGYGSSEPAMFALELPAGWLQSIGLPLDEVEGMKVSW